MAEKTAAPHSRYSRMRRASSAKRPLSSLRCRERQPCSRWTGIIQISAPLARRTATSSTSETAVARLQMSPGSHSPALLPRNISSSLPATLSHGSCEVIVCVCGWEKKIKKNAPLVDIATCADLGRVHGKKLTARTFVTHFVSPSWHCSWSGADCGFNPAGRAERVFVQMQAVAVV